MGIRFASTEGLNFFSPGGVFQGWVGVLLDAFDNEVALFRQQANPVADDQLFAVGFRPAEFFGKQLWIIFWK